MILNKANFIVFYNKTFNILYCLTEGAPRSKHGNNSDNYRFQW